MNALDFLLILLYSGCLFFIFCYSLIQFNLTWLYRRKAAAAPAVNPWEQWPKVTVQLPVYNEKYVIERLIDCVAKLDYPQHLLQIQVLDDSSDETIALAAAKTEHYRSLGLQIEHIRRPNRTGYKAGALEYGLTHATGDFIAIFDADFLPGPAFLKETIIGFDDESVGVVQTRWGHINAEYSLLTRLQAFGLNAHFTIEQSGRNSGGHFINFNGTAGVWRKSCIQDAGGWQPDTLTEDLDLSYRAQLKNWKFKYFEHVEAPAELPAAMPALKSQQYRWTKGAAETARKHLAQVLLQPLNWRTRIHATFHLLNSGIFICVLLSAILSVPLLFVKHRVPELGMLFKVASLFLLSLFGLMYFYYTSYQRSHQASFFRFLGDFLLFLSLSMGLSLHNAVAVLEGYAGRRTPFVRTPKFDIKSASDSWQQKQYLARQLHPLIWLEGMLAVYFAYGLYAGWQVQDFGLMPFHTLLTFGFGAVFFYSVRHNYQSAC